MSNELVIFYAALTGVIFTFAAISLIIGLQKDSEKTYLLLGVIGICVSIYYIIITIYETIYGDSWLLWIGFFFFLINFALLPWFFSYYTGFKNIPVQWGLSIGMIITFILLVLTKESSNPLLWNIFAHFVLLGILIFGFVAANYQRKHGKKSSSWFLAGALVIFSLLGLDDIWFVYFYEVYPLNHSPHFLPLDYFPVLFLILMGFKLARDMQLKYSLERTLSLHQRRWDILLDRVQLLVVGVGQNEIINFVNPYFLQLTGFRKEDIIGKHFQTIVPEEDQKSLKQLRGTVKKAGNLPYYQNRIITADGELKTIAWSLVGMYNESGDYINSISIGSDITAQQNAFEEISSLKARLEQENILLKTELNKITATKKIVGESEAIRYVLQRAMQVAPTDSTVLLEGETGVGKELVANYIQENSAYAKKPYIKLNCAAIPASLLESELFGYVRGAFTGADKNKKGLVELAQGGTLFLDEIGEFPLELQPKLLRFLQEGEYQPLGSEVSKKVKVRIIAATNKELLHEIEKGSFRNDLYYRLYVYPITIPALRNRKEDIPELIEVFAKQYATKYRKPITKVSKLLVQELKEYQWPGNIRELENLIERAVIVATSDTLKLKDLSPVILDKPIPKTRDFERLKTLEEIEREHIIKALKITKWQIHGTTGAANILGINPSTLRSRMKKLNISKP